jgi:predicted ferric reductase
MTADVSRPSAARRPAGPPRPGGRGPGGQAPVPQRSAAHGVRSRHLPAYAAAIRSPQWWRDLAGGLTWLSVLVVVALWVSNRGLQNLGGWADGLTSLGRLAGLLSADLLLVQVLLMARIPFVERSYGQDELAHRHRWVGFASFNLLLAHLLLIVLGYAAADGSGVLRTTWSMVTTYPGMLLATAATALLVMVVVTSVKVARKKLRYESWHLLHLYAYLGVGLSIPHEVWTGADFISSPVARLYWWTLYAAALGAVLVYRVGLPVYRSVRHRLVVSAVVPEGPDVVSVYLRGRHLHELPVAAGQFFTWRFLDGPGWSRAHPYSLSAVPVGDQLRITVKDLGDSHPRLRRMTPGTRVLVEGPYGRLTAAARTRRKITLLASGIGITPMRALLEDLPYSPGDATLVYRARSEQDLVLKNELDALARSRGARVYYAVGPRRRDRSSWLPASAGNLSDSAALRQLVPDIREHDVFLCGAQEWMDSARAAVLKTGVPPERIHLERFGW